MAVNSDYFIKIEAFKSLTDDQRSRVIPLCEEVVFQEGNRLFAEGDPAKHVWFVVDGQVDLRFEWPLRRRTSVEHTISSEEASRQEAEAKTLGWSCFVPPYKMMLSAYCANRTCRIIRIRKEELLQLFEDDPVIGYRFLTYIIAVLGYRFIQLEEEVAKMTGNEMITGW
jgi:CRP-like cAMP-binding protein